MSELLLFGNPSELPPEERDKLDLSNGVSVEEWAFIKADGEEEPLPKGVGIEVSIPADQQLVQRIVGIIEKLVGGHIDKEQKEQKEQSDWQVEAYGEPVTPADKDIFSIDVPLVSQSETTGQHWSLGGGVGEIFGTRRQAVNSFGLNGDCDAGEDIGVVIVDVGLNRDYVNKLGHANTYGGGWRRASPPQPAGLYQPGDYQNPVGRMSSGHGNMIARNILSLAPRATLYDAAILPERVLNFKAFSRHATAIMRGIERVIVNPNGVKFFPKHKHWIIVNAWAVATSFADTSDTFSYADNRLHRLNAKLIELASLKNVEVVFAAGNSGAFQPARFAGPYDRGHARSIWGANGLEEVHTIGAVRTDGLSIGASSQGPSRPNLLAALPANGDVNQKPNFCAPSWFSEDDDRSVINNGTSAACAMYAGYLAATVGNLSLSSTATVKDKVKTTASRKTDWDSQRGYGTVRAPVGLGV